LGKYEGINMKVILKAAESSKEIRSRLNFKNYKIKNFIQFLLMFVLMLQFLTCNNSDGLENDIVQNEWKSLKTIDEDGLLGEKVNLWRNNRLFYIEESGYLIDGFENRPGIHPWQGEHIGKWIHATTLAYSVTGNEKIKKDLDNMVKRLLATQLPNGYMGTYESSYTFMAMPENGVTTKLADDIQPANKKGNSQASDKAPCGGWDVWTLRYNLYGLLTYEKYFPNDTIVEACRKMGDLLIDYYGKGKYDLTRYGTRNGISSTTLLESIVMLHKRTMDKKYLDFAKHIVDVSENNSKLRLMGTMLEKGSVVEPGDGKAYQLMANLLGYLLLYRCTDNEEYLQTVLNAWDDIYHNHLLVTGGPWSRKMPYNGNRECFAYPEDFDMDKILVEGCCDATWIILNIQLFELTGDAKYMNQAEVTLLNDAYEHQSTDGIEYCYYTNPNEKLPHYEKQFHCCASSLPRGFEMFSDHLAGEINKNLSVNSFSPSVIQLTNQFGGGVLKIEGNYPLGSSAKIYLENNIEKKFTLEFRIPVNTRHVSVFVNGEKINSTINERGFAEISRSWKKGDMVAIDLDYRLKAHVQSGENGNKWIAFTYGPLALAQKISEMPKEEPFMNIPSTEASEFLKMLIKSSDSETEFSIKGTEIILIPYYQTGSKASGPRTYFKL